MSFFVTALLVLPISILFYELDIVNSELEVERYFVCGSVECELGNGQKVTIDGDSRVWLLNQSGAPFFLEEVVYSAYDVPSERTGIFLNAHSVTGIPQIDFWPDQLPPERMQLRAGDANVKYWLRPATNEEIKP